MSLSSPTIFVFFLVAANGAASWSSEKLFLPISFCLLMLRGDKSLELPLCQFAESLLSHALKKAIDVRGASLP